MLWRKYRNGKLYGNRRNCSLYLYLGARRADQRHGYRSVGRKLYPYGKRQERLQRHCHCNGHPTGFGIICNNIIYPDCLFG